MTRGKFITFEGGEGTGKSTQAARLAARLAGGGRTVMCTREPGGTPLGERLRELILSTRPSPFAEFLLFASARAEHVSQKVQPALQRGDWVVCDRFIDSTRVYQGSLAGIAPRVLRLIEEETAATAWPDLTLVLDLPTGVGQARATERGALNRYDAEDASYHERIRRGFLEIAASEPRRCVVIDAAASADAVEAAVWGAVESRLLGKVG